MKVRFQLQSAVSWPPWCRVSGGHTKVVTRMTPGYLCILDICPGQDSGSRVSTKKETKTPAALSPDWCRAVCLLPFTPDTASLPPSPDNLHDLCSPQHGEKLRQARSCLDTEHWSTSRFLIVCLVLSPGLDCGIVEWRYDGRLCSHTASFLVTTTTFPPRP